MEVKINTKYNVGDIVYGIYNNQYLKFKVDQIKATGGFRWGHEYIGDIEYECLSVPDKHEEDCCLCLKQTYNEYELRNKEELKAMYDSLLKED